MHSNTDGVSCNLSGPAGQGAGLPSLHPRVNYLLASQSVSILIFRLCVAALPPPSPHYRRAAHLHALLSLTEFDPRRPSASLAATAAAASASVAPRPRTPRARARAPRRQRRERQSRGLPAAAPLPSFGRALAVVGGVAAALGQVAGAAPLGDRVHHSRARHRVNERRLFATCNQKRPAM